MKSDKKIENCYMWRIIAPRLGWRWNIRATNDFGQMGEMLRRTKVDLRDVAVIFYTKMARWSEESLSLKIEKAFKEWIEEQHHEAQQMYDELDEDESKKDIEAIVKQLKKYKERE